MNQTGPEQQSAITYLPSSTMHSQQDFTCGPQQQTARTVNKYLKWNNNFACH